MIYIELSLVALFLLVAHWLDRENKRVVAERDSAISDHGALMVHYRDTKTELAELQEDHESLLETACELQVELDAYHREDERRERRRSRAVLN